jgi:hypothetical protein
MTFNEAEVCRIVLEHARIQYNLTDDNSKSGGWRATKTNPSLHQHDKLEVFVDVEEASPSKDPYR